MGQALAVLGALGLTAAGTAYGAYKLHEVAAFLRDEPRHAPGSLEAELAAEIDAVSSQQDAAATASVDDTVLKIPAASTATAEACALGDSVSHCNVGVGVTAAAGGEAVTRELLESNDPAQRRAKMVGELRALREKKERARRDWEEWARQQHTAGPDVDSGAAAGGSIAAACIRWEEARRNYPRPAWLTTKCCINVAVTGNSGVGKSSFINTVRGLRARDAGAAEVSPNEATREPTPYDLADLSVKAKLWDLPGAGTRRWPRESYVQQTGLRYFDVVIILTASRYTETEIMIADELKQFNVPFLMARNKVDADVANNEDDHGSSKEETLASLRQDMQRQGVERPYLVSSRFARRDEFDFSQLVADCLRAVCEAREISRHELLQVAASSLVATHGGS